MAENVKQVKTYLYNTLYITKDNKLYLYNIYNNNSIEIQGIEINNDTEILDKCCLISDGKMYNFSNKGDVYIMNTNAVKAYYNKYFDNEFLSNKSMYVIKKDNQIIIKNEPNITKICEKSNYNMRMVFEKAVFVQGKGQNINIVDKRGKVYENTNSKENDNIENVKKIIASSNSKYVLKNDGTLWAKGANSTGMWGEYAEKNDYVQITKNGTDAFKNVKNIYTSKIGSSAIFTTEDNKIYWAGATALINLPQIKGDVAINGIGSVTYYPKEVNSPVIGEIKEKIKDIEYSFINNGGIYGNNTLILTEDGKLYTMSTNKNMSGNNTVASNSSRRLH